MYGVRTEETVAHKALINRYDYDGIFGTGEASGGVSVAGPRQALLKPSSVCLHKSSAGCANQANSLLAA